MKQKGKQPVFFFFVSIETAKDLACSFLIEYFIRRSQTLTRWLTTKSQHGSGVKCNFLSGYPRATLLGEKKETLLWLR